jgi:hypothetical protein
MACWPARGVKVALRWTMVVKARMACRASSALAGVWRVPVGMRHAWPVGCSLRMRMAHSAVCRDLGQGLERVKALKALRLPADRVGEGDGTGQQLQRAGVVGLRLGCEQPG